METSIVPDLLSNKSLAYSLQFVDGSSTVKINCVDLVSAIALKKALMENALDAEVIHG